MRKANKQKHYRIRNVFSQIRTPCWDVLGVYHELRAALIYAYICVYAYMRMSYLCKVSS